jgi:hypothetical protein
MCGKKLLFSLVSFSVFFSYSFKKKLFTIYLPVKIYGMGRKSLLLSFSFTAI